MMKHNSIQLGVALNNVGRQLQDVKKKCITATNFNKTGVGSMRMQEVRVNYLHGVVNIT